MAETVYPRPFGGRTEKELKTMSRTAGQNSATLMRIVCAILFLIFTFTYLYFYQADVLAVTQHLLSGGQTHYDRTIGAVLLTLVLYVLHLGVLALTKLTRRAHAITYFPSLLALSVLTGIHVYNDGSFDFGRWYWLGTVLLVVFAVLAFFLYKLHLFEQQIKLSYNPLRLLWMNMLLMCAMFIFVGFTSNHSDVFHYRMRMESCLQNKDYDGALKVGEKEAVADSNLTLLRIHALARKRQLGERLFEYPLCGGSSVMLPDGRNVKPLMYPSYKFIKYPALDFELCKYLLDKDLGSFANLINERSDVYALSEDSLKDALPKHYREALVLYNRLKANPVVSYHHEVFDADFEDFLKLMKKEKTVDRLQKRLRSVYGNTYWFYYYFL